MNAREKKLLLIAAVKKHNEDAADSEDRIIPSDIFSPEELGSDLCVQKFVLQAQQRKKKLARRVGDAMLEKGIRSSDQDPSMMDPANNPLIQTEEFTDEEKAAWEKQGEKERAHQKKILK